MEEARAVRDLARGNIGGFLRHEASASHHNRAVREENMAANSAMGLALGFAGAASHRHMVAWVRRGGGSYLCRGGGHRRCHRGWILVKLSECTEHLTSFRGHPGVSLCTATPGRGIPSSNHSTSK